MLHGPRRSALHGGLLRAGLLGGLVAVLVLGSPARGEDASPARVAELQARLAASRSKLEQAYLVVVDDHAKVRADGFAAALREPEVADVLSRMFASLERAAQAERDELAATLIEHMPLRAPLSKASMTRVLQAALRAEATAGATAAERFAAAADALFAKGPADAWDAAFQDLPVVAVWRQANADLAAARRSPEVPGDSTEPGVPRPAEPETPQPDPGPAPLLVEPVFFPRGRVAVGPWQGWTGELSDRDNKRQKRPCKAVYMDRYEVTCAQYLEFLAGVPAKEVPGLLPADWTLGIDGKARLPEGRERHPVTGVTFEQARAYAASLGKRLPTEDEWERAAAGDGEPRKYPWGDSPDGRSWPHGGGDATVEPVDAFPDDTSPEGVVGLAGNVAELVAAFPDRKPIGRGKLASNAQVVIRGGSFRSRASECTSTFRWVVDASEPSPHVGFRCVMDEAEYKRRERK